MIIEVDTMAEALRIRLLLDRARALTCVGVRAGGGLHDPLGTRSWTRVRRRFDGTFVVIFDGDVRRIATEAVRQQCFTLAQRTELLSLIGPANDDRHDISLDDADD